MIEMPRGGPNAGALDRAFETAEDEWLDDPAVPQAKKQAVITGLDRFNRRVFAYKQFTRWVIDALPSTGKARVIELGAGHGALAATIAETLRDRAEVIASDISEAFVDGMRASPRLQSLGVKAEVVDATRMPYADQSFDVAIFTQSLHHLPPSLVVQFMREGARVAKTLILVDGWRSPLMLLISPGFWLLGNYAAFRDGIISLRKMYGKAALLALATEAGVQADVRFMPPGYMRCLVQRAI